MLEEESGYPFPDIMGAPPPGYVQRNETIIFAPRQAGRCKTGALRCVAASSLLSGIARGLCLCVRHPGSLRSHEAAQGRAPGLASTAVLLTARPCHATCSWLLGFWLERGIDGWWEIEPVPPQVMIHVVFVPGPMHPPYKKVSAWFRVSVWLEQTTNRPCTRPRISAPAHTPHLWAVATGSGLTWHEPPCLPPVRGPSLPWPRRSTS